MTGTCKLLIIFTALIVIISFGFRVFLDREISISNKLVTDNNQQLKYYLPIESQSRELISSIDLYKKFSTSQITVSDDFEYFKKIFADNLKEVNISINKELVSITGISDKVFIEKIEKELKQNSKYTNVLVSNLESTQTNNLDILRFSIRANIVVEKQ